jgi:glycosyltransferase involved in cell wall biosynthesis
MISNTSSFPLVSIITVCFNSGEYIEKTIQSVLEQTYQHIEYVIIDGGSTDSTLDIVEKYRDRVFRIISEPDKGIYDAMNKGVINSSGDIIYFLNSGDQLFRSDTIEHVVGAFTSSNVMAVYGNVQMLDKNRTAKTIRGCKVSLKSLLYRRICHQALFSKRQLFDELGPFSDDLHLSADHDHIVRGMKKYPEGFVYLDEVLAKYLDGGMSCKMMTLTKKEDLGIISSNYNRIEYLFGAFVCMLVIIKYRIISLIDTK